MSIAANGVGVIVKKGLPALRSWPPSSCHLLRHGGLADIDAKLREFAVDAWSNASPPPLDNDPSRDVRLQMQLHLPNRPGNRFHTHNGDQWEAVIEGEITFTVRGQEPRVLKAGESVYIPRGTVHRNENKSSLPTRTIELLIMDKGRPQNTPAE
jgi:mannose-6-phosphate isomerase-like protein (cupin superfamily)